MLRFCVLLNEKLKSQLKKVNQRQLSAIRSHFSSSRECWPDLIGDYRCRNWEILPRESTWPKQVFSDFTASLEDLWNVSSNQASFVWKVTVGFGTGFMLCLSYSIIWPVLNGGRFRLCKLLLLCTADDKQSNVAFCGGVPKAPLTVSFEKLCMNPSNKSQFPNFLFFIPLHHCTLLYFFFQCSNCGSYMVWFANLAIFAAENPLIWTDVFCNSSNTGYSMSFVFFFFVFFLNTHEENHEPLPFLKNKPPTFKIIPWKLQRIPCHDW